MPAHVCIFESSQLEGSCAGDLLSSYRSQQMCKDVEWLEPQTQLALAQLLCQTVWQLLKMFNRTILWPCNSTSRDLPKRHENIWPQKSERVTGRKARGLQMEEMGCKCQTIFLSLLSSRRKQTSVRFFSPSLYKFKKRFLLKFCFHDDTWFHLNLTFLKSWAN